MTWTDLQGLLDALPPSSATRRAEAGVDDEWGPLEFMVADLVDLAQTQLYVQRRLHFKGTPDAPVPLRRPLSIEDAEADGERVHDANVPLAVHTEGVGRRQSSVTEIASFVRRRGGR